MSPVSVRAAVVVLVLAIAVFASGCGDGSDNEPFRETAPFRMGDDAVPTAIPVLSPTPTVPPPATPEPFVYIVKEGDTLGGISDEFGVAQQEIEAVNELENPDILSVGQQIVIPQDASVATNSDGTVRPGERTHVVAAGDTLLGIAARYDTTLDAITEANNITTSDLITVGQQLVIPAADPAP